MTATRRFGCVRWACFVPLQPLPFEQHPVARSPHPVQPFPVLDEVQQPDGFEADAVFAEFVDAQALMHTLAIRTKK